MNKKIILFYLAILLAIPGLTAQTVKLEQVESLAGPVFVKLDLLGFTGTNGNVGAITLFIEYDQTLLTYTGPTSVPFMGGTIIINPNYGADEWLGISWMNFAGANIDGTFLTLQFEYLGGFVTDLVFVESYEITNIYGTPITATYDDGGISPVEVITPFLEIEKVIAEGAELIPLPDPPGGELLVPDPVEVNIYADGLSAESIGSIVFVISYDATKLNYTGFDPGPLGAGWVLDPYASGFLSISRATESGMTFADGELLTLYFDYLYVPDPLTDGMAEIAFEAGTHMRRTNTSYIPFGMKDGWVWDALPGDADCSGEINIDDIIIMINHIFNGDPIPCFEAADMNKDGFVLIEDLVQVINIVFPTP